MTPVSRRLLLLAPLGVAALGGGAFWAMLEGMQRNRFDPRGMPSVLVGRKLPPFALPGLDPHAGFANTDIGGRHGPLLLNFFASWCLPCLMEAPQLLALQQRGVPVWGIAYKDKRADTSLFLQRNGDPFSRVAVDETGRTAIDFGVYGVPETYLVDRDGIVRWRWAGALTDDIIADQLEPLLRAYP